MSALGLFAVAPEVANAARKSDRRDDNQGRDNEEPRDNRDDVADKNQRDRGSDQHSNSGASAEDQDTSDESRKSEKRDRDDSRREVDESSEQSTAEGGKTRDESSRRNADSDSNSRDDASADDDSGQGGRHVRELEQQAAEQTDDTTTVTPSNPNVDVTDIPTTSIADLVVEANDDVIATVSTSGGFAFARSGDVIAITGPDGASIIQTGDVTTGTDGIDPTEPPDDGGNNDLDFTS